MAFQRVPDTAEVTFRFSGVAGGHLVGCEAEFSLYVRDEVTEWTATQLQRLVDYMEAWWTAGKNAGAALNTVVDDGWNLDYIEARNLDVQGGVVVREVENTTGQRAGAVGPPNVAVLVQYQLDAGGSPSRGWLFFPGGVEDDLEGTNWTAAFVALVKARFDDMDADLADAGAGGFASWAQVRVSRAAGTEAQLAAVRAAREALKEAIAATRRNEATTNTLGNAVSVPRRIASMAKRRSD